MLQKKKWILTGIVGALMMTGIYAGQAIISRADGGTQPGSVDDPLVTKSYLEEQLRKWTGQPPPAGSGTGSTGSGQAVSEARIKELIAAEVAKLKQDLPSQPGTGTGSPTPSTGAPATLEVIKLEAGQILYAGAGTEVIVRTGKAIAVSSDDGIPDATSGKDIAAGSAIENNHLLIFPREGRGIKPDPRNTADIYVMIRGSYILLKEDNTKSAP